jgi:hypothetical protein
MKHLLLLAFLAPSQDLPESALARRIDSQIPWLSDGVVLVDNSQPGRAPKEAPVDREALLAQARKLARERGRLILWYCPRTPGTHMYRAALLDTYLKAAIFSDPGFVELVQAKFVPLRMACDEKRFAALGFKRFQFVEPGFLLLSPEGRIVHAIDRIRTFNADWMRAALVSVLRKNDEYNAPAGGSPEDLLRGGDDEKALEKATPGQKALILRRAGRYEEVLALEAGPLQKGLALLGLRRYDEARAALERDASAESIYHRAAIDWWTGKDPEPRLREVMRLHPETPWAWRAAANLARGPDTLRDGPMTHLFEDFTLVPPAGAPASTRLPASDPEAAARGAAEFLLRAQRESGAWSDSRYCYWPDIGLLPNVHLAVTALAALALSERRDLAPARIDAAVARAEKYILDESRLARGKNEEAYAEAYRLLYFAGKKDAAAMNRIATRLAALQDKDGFWGHEYPNPFTTAAVVHSLAVARKAGADVPDSYFRKAADALTKTRGDGGRQAYESAGKPTSEKNSAGRVAPCELALWECGKGSLENVAASLETYWKLQACLEAVRNCDFHADGELAGFFYFHSVFHSVEAARALADPKRREHLDRFRAQVLSIAEFDGSFVDSHELGKSYGTAMALLVLTRTR